MGQSYPWQCHLPRLCRYTIIWYFRQEVQTQYMVKVCPIPMVLTLLLKRVMKYLSISLVGLDQKGICVHCVHIHTDCMLQLFSYWDKNICYKYIAFHWTCTMLCFPSCMRTGTGASPTATSCLGRTAVWSCGMRAANGVTRHATTTSPTPARRAPVSRTTHSYHLSHTC